MYDEIKSTIDRTIARLRYSDDEQANSPTDEIDPETWHHEATPGLGERLKRKRGWLTLYGMLAAAILLVLSQWFGMFMIAIVTHPIVWKGSLVVGLFVVGYYQGAKWQRGKIQEYDWWVGMLPDGPQVWLGEYRTADDGTMIFMPFRGFDWLGFRSRQLQLGELGESVAHHHSKRGRDMESPARIRLDDAITRVQDTAMGTVAVTLTSGVKPDQFGQHSDAYAAPPELADKQMYSELRNDYQRYVEDIVPEKEADIKALKQTVENLRAMLEESEDEKVDKVIERFERLLHASQTTDNRHGRTPSHSQNGQSATEVPAFAQGGDSE